MSALFMAFVEDLALVASAQSYWMTGAGCFIQLVRDKVLHLSFCLCPLEQNNELHQAFVAGVEISCRGS